MVCGASMPGVAAAPSVTRAGAAGVAGAACGMSGPFLGLPSIVMMSTT